ncbi:hypothetical protein NHX12_019155, partial [Muraenolepis orangiensis]
MVVSQTTLSPAVASTTASSEIVTDLTATPTGLSTTPPGCLAVNTSTCQLCVPGSYYDNVTLMCSCCPDPGFCLFPGACLSCARGFFQPLPGQQQCLPCGQGFYSNGDKDSIKVFVRVRPLTQGTGLSTDGDQNLCLTVTSHNTIRLHSKPEPRTFTYDHVADMDISQDSVFACVAKDIVESCINGYNGTIFAYGQTGSGKTFTMLGPSDSDNFTDELRGVIPLFFLINREVERSGKSKSFLCKCSFIEIYNEQIYDLLDSASASLFLRENIKKGVFVEGAVEKFVTSAAEAYQVLSMGWRNRRVASTSMNRESSRSHAVFTMALESKEVVNEVVNIRMSQLNLVDLAGSERQKDTHTEGSRLKEASSINRSLMCLGQVIMALVDVSNGKNRHICYRDSKLTFLLRDSLGGNAKTCIIANVHPGSKCFGETLSTLHFAQRAKLIKNKAMINEDTQGNVRQLQAEVKKLKEQLAQAMISGRDVAPGGPQLSISPSNNHLEVSYKAKFLQAIGLWKKREEEKTWLLQKMSQLEEAWAQKEKFIHSSRMIVKFREEHTTASVGVVLDLINQTRELRSELSEKEDNLAQLSGDVKDITAKYNAVTSEQEEVQEQNSRMQTKLHDMKAEVGKKAASSQIEVELLQDEVLYATEEVERLTKVLGEQNGLLQSFQEQTTEKEALIQNLQQQLKQQEEAAEKASSNTDLSQGLERQELESRRSSMITMEILLAEHNSERSAKNAEIQRLK